MKDMNYTSPTQIGQFIDCIRKWFFEYVIKLPVNKGYHFAYGIVFHAVCARYLKSDDAGKDENGTPVDLYPKGWLETDDGIVTKADGEWIENLISLGIEEGIFQKFQGREVETKMDRLLTSTTRMIGYIDLLLPHERTVTDHKTSKDFRYILSPAALKEDIQMLIYAAELVIRHMEKYGEELPKVILRHNQFQKQGTPRVKFTEAEVTINEIDKNWERCKEIADQMDQWRFTAKENWEKVPGPKDINICNKYGGCPFIRICGKTETPDFYRKRINRILNNIGEPIGEKSMGLFDQLKKNKKDSAPAKEEKAEAAPAGEQEVFKTPPWAQENCNACTGAGLNTKGTPCRICDAVAKAKGLPISSDFVFVPDLDGWILADDAIPTKEEKKEEKKESLDTVDPSKIKNTGLKKALLQKQGKTTNEEKISEEEDESKEKTIKQPEKKGKATSKKGRPPAGITLCISCAPTSFGSREVVSMDTIFQEMKEKVGKAMGGDFYEQDQWKRKDALAVAVSHSIDAIGPVFVVANPNGNGLDYKACLEAFRGYAQTVIEGLH